MTTPDMDCYEVLQVHPRAHPQVITAAYRALARMLHPDHAGDRTDAPMARLNRAYAVVRDPESRATYDRQREAAAAPPKTQRPLKTPTPPATGRSGTVLRYGRYEGWTLQDLVRHDSDYLRWLQRHPSGRQYRAELDRLLAKRTTPEPLYRR